MLNNLKTILTIFSLSLLLGCKSLLISTTVKSNVDKDVKVYLDTEQNKIVYIPTIHLGKKGYYNSIKRIVDSLRKENYTVLFEGLEIDTSDTGETPRKFRKITGFYLSGSYKDEENNSISNAYKKDKYEVQTTDKIGVDKDVDIRADYSLDSLIFHYENKFGEIILTKCDYETSLLSKYECKDKNKYSEFDLLHIIREEKLYKLIHENKENNIVILYGRAHRFGIHAFLRDEGYELIEGKL